MTLLQTNQLNAARRFRANLCHAVLGGPHRRLVPLALMAAVLMPGCSRSDDGRVPVHPVTGKVVVAGKPAAGAFVVFHPKAVAHPEAIPARAQVAPDGTFKLTTYESADGAAAGEYAVTVEWRKLVTSGGETKAGPNVLPAKYSQPKTTDLVIKVAEGLNDLKPIEIRR